jgi:hypothetical protein
MGVLKAYLQEAKKLSKSSQAITIGPNVGHPDTPVVGEDVAIHVKNGDRVRINQPDSEYHGKRGTVTRTNAVSRGTVSHHVRIDGENGSRVFSTHNHRLIKEDVASEAGIDESVEESTIGPIKKGAFHRWLGKSPDAKITAADIAKGKAAGGHAAEMATFAQNFGHIGEAHDHEKFKPGDIGDIDLPGHHLHGHTVTMVTPHSIEVRGSDKVSHIVSKFGSSYRVPTGSFKKHVIREETLYENFRELAKHANPNISYPGVEKMGQVKEETITEAGVNPNHDAAALHMKNKLKRSMRRHINSQKK